MTSWFSKNPYRVTNFESIYPSIDLYSYGIRNKQPNIDRLLYKEEGQAFLVEEAKIIAPTPQLQQLNSASYITAEPDRKLFSLAQGGIYGGDGIVYDTRTRYAIAETVEHWNLAITQNPSLGLPRFPTARHLPGITCNLASYAGQTFYHFLIETLPKVYFLKNLLPNCQRIIIPRYLEPVKQKWLEFVGIHNEILWLDGLDHYICDQLLFTNRFVRHFEPNPWAVNTLRHLVKLDLYSSKYPKKIIWASRRASPQRQIPWEKQLISHLNQMEEVDFGQLNPLEVITLCGETKSFVGFHGAAFSNLVFCPPGCRVVEILVSDEEMWYARLSAICGHKHTCIRISESHPDLVKLAQQITQLISED